MSRKREVVSGNVMWCDVRRWKGFTLLAGSAAGERRLGRVEKKLRLGEGGEVRDREDDMGGRASAK